MSSVYQETADKRLEKLRDAANDDTPMCLRDWMREVESQLAALRTVALQNAARSDR